MRNPRKCLLGIACVAIWAAHVAGCVDSDPSGPGGSTGTGTTTTTGSGGTGGEAGQGGEPGQGGSGATGGGAPSPSLGGTEWASAGGVVKSEKYVMHFTFGQPTSNQGKSTSSSYRIQGGLVGANGSMK